MGERGGGGSVYEREVVELRGWAVCYVELVHEWEQGRCACALRCWDWCLSECTCVGRRAREEVHIDV